MREANGVVKCFPVMVDVEADVVAFADEISQDRIFNQFDFWNIAKPRGPVLKMPHNGVRRRARSSNVAAGYGPETISRLPGSSGRP